MTITRFLAILFLGGILFSSGSCKLFARRWAKKKRTEFLNKCNTSNAVKFISNSEDFCDCALDVVMDKYPDPDEGLALKIVEVIKMTKDCIQN